MDNRGIRNEKLLCAKCATRQARRANGLCTKCDLLRKAEKIDVPGLRENFEERHEKARAAAVAQFNALIDAGHDLYYIAALWGCSRKQVSARMSRARRKGHQPRNLAEARAIVYQDPLPITPKTRGGMRNEHGGGVEGVNNCKCEPCVTVRRATHNARSRAKSSKK